MTRIYWDTMLFVYWLENHPELEPRVSTIWRRMQARGDELCASAFTLCELMVSPCRRNDAAGASQLEEFFQSPGVTMLPLVPACAQRFGRIRAQAKVSATDALHLAIAGAHGVELFLTHDRRLQSLKVPGIDFIAGIETELLS